MSNLYLPSAITFIYSQIFSLKIGIVYCIFNRILKLDIYQLV